jgi:signal transduction histidine kinase
MSSLHPAAMVKSVDDRLIAAMRTVLALSALVITFIDPSVPAHYVPVTNAILALYTAYSLLLYMLARRQNSPLLLGMSHWLDIEWYGVLIGLSGSTNSVFFFFFFFAILVASFRWGFAAGCRTTLAAVVLCTTVGLLRTPSGVPFEPNRFLLRPIYILVLGYMIACWGEAEIKLKRRLALLKDISAPANLRFGVDQTLGRIMQQLCAFYAADICLLVTAEHTTGEYSVRRSDRHNPEAIVRAVPIPAELARVLLALPAAQELVYSSATSLWRWWRPAVAASSLEAAPLDVIPARVCEIFAAASFVTVPFCSAGAIVGRLYLTSSRRRGFENADVDFLLHVLEQTVPILDNIQLVHHLASDAAERERQRIAGNLHDSVLQPCIGLRLGLAAALQRFRLVGTKAGEEIECVIKLSDAAIADLRRCIGALRDGNTPQESLLPALQHYAKQFAKATGIAVQVKAEGDMRLNARLDAEVSQMVAEGLSNIRRHTRSAWATVDLACHNGHLVVRMENDAAAGESPGPFTPHSIAERAAAMGGHMQVRRTDTGGTVVCIDIPL